MRIYITRMKFTCEKEDKKYYEKAYDLIAELKNQGHEIIYVSDDEFKFADYNVIWESISSCDCLLAFTDQYTLSSTWRNAEITYALHGIGVYEKVDFRIPVFFYTAIDEHKSVSLDSYMRMVDDHFILPDDINSAAQIIETIMKKLKNFS